VRDGVEHARNALEHWRYLADARPASASARRALAMSHIKLGDLLGNPNLPNLSDRAGATVQYHRALALLRVLPPDSVNDWATRRQLALVHERLGSMLELDGRHDDAIAAFEQSLAIREGLARERSASVNALRDLAVTHQLLCEAQLARGNSDTALAHCRKSLDLYQTLRSAEPSNAQSLYDLARGHQSMHRVLGARRQLTASLAHLDRSSELIRRLLEAHSGNVPARRDFARNLLFASAVHARLATTSGVSLEEANAHRRQATAAYESGQRLLLELGQRGKLSEDDEDFLNGIRAQLAELQLQH
jgi:tetratricopeptide (TPR) repeat protein